MYRDDGILIANVTLLWQDGMVRFTLLLCSALFGVQVWLSFDPSLPIALGVLFMFVIAMLWLVLFMSILINIYRFNLRRFVTRAMLLALAVAIFQEGGAAADYVHLIIMYPHYMAVIADRTGPIYFNWEPVKFGFIPTLRTDRTLIYDVSGVSPGKPERKGYPYDGDGTVHLFGHFYIKEDTTPD